MEKDIETLYEVLPKSSQIIDLHWPIDEEYSEQNTQYFIETFPPAVVEIESNENIVDGAEASHGCLQEFQGFTQQSKFGISP